MTWDHPARAKRAERLQISALALGAFTVLLMLPGWVWTTLGVFLLGVTSLILGILAGQQSARTNSRLVVPGRIGMMAGIAAIIYGYAVLITT